jgi:hypothetical protein
MLGMPCAAAACGSGNVWPPPLKALKENGHDVAAYLRGDCTHDE